MHYDTPIRAQFKWIEFNIGVLVCLSDQKKKKKKNSQSIFIELLDKRKQISS